MSETSTDRPPLLMDLAARIADAFPDMERRVFAVSEVEPFTNKTNRPRLPLAVVALVSEENTTSGRGGATSVQIQSDVLVQFAFEPVKYQTGDNQDTPFFAFYDYEAIRNRMLEMLRSYRGPMNESVTYRSLDVESDPFAVYVSVRIRVAGDLCYGATEAIDFRIKANVNAARGICEPCAELPPGCDVVCDPPVAHEPLE